jgi:hypothetical protein
VGAALPRPMHDKEARVIIDTSGGYAAGDRDPRQRVPAGTRPRVSGVGWHARPARAVSRVADMLRGIGPGRQVRASDSVETPISGAVSP